MQAARLPLQELPAAVLPPAMQGSPGALGQGRVTHTCLGLCHVHGSAQIKKKEGLEGTALGAGLFLTPVQRIIHYGHDQHRGISFTEQPDSFSLIYKRRLFSFVQTWKTFQCCTSEKLNWWCKSCFHQPKRLRKAIQFLMPLLIKFIQV